MKIQFTLIDPDLISRSDGNQTIVMGIAKTKEVMSNYDLKYLSLGHALGMKAGVLFDTHENLMHRDEYITHDLHSMLSKPIWERTEAFDNVSGEITFLKTQPIEVDEALPHNYIFLGLLCGQRERIKSFVGHISEIQLPSDPESGQPRIAPVSTSSIKANHIMGSHFTTMLSQVIWGWGCEKRGMRYLNSEQEALKTFSAVKSYLDTGKVTPEMSQYGVSRDPDYLRYLRAINKLEPLTFRQWETKSERDHAKALATKAVRQMQCEVQPG